MNTNEQAPECCPFCGAGIRIEKDGSQCRAPRGTWVGFNCCTTWHQGYHDQRRLQSLPCILAERERLTRERDEAREALEISRQRSAEKDLRIEDLKKRLQLAQCDLSVRIKEVEKLESEWSGWPDLQREWFGGKYAAMQPWDAVRARIEDSEARVQRLEEALNDIAKEVPAHDGGGGLFWPMFDGDGNEIGFQPVDPLTVIGAMHTRALDALRGEEAKEAKP